MVPHDPARAGDRRAELERVLGDVILRRIRNFYFVGRGPDEILQEIARHQGFDGPARVVDREQMGRMVNSGEVTEMWRGLTAYQVRMGDSYGWRSAADLAEEYRTGEYFAGQGNYGNGIYAAEERRYAGDMMRSGDEGGLLRIGLRSDARVIDFRTLDGMIDEFIGLYDNTEAFNRIQAGGSLTDEEMKRFVPGYAWADTGRYAAALGYDAIKVRRASGAFYIILNRTATVVQEAE